MNRLSSLDFHNSLRMSASKTQIGMQRAQTEVSTGRKWDVGLSLGAQVSRNISWRNELSSNEQQISVNTIASARAKLTQAGLEQIKDIGNRFIATMTGARSAQNGQQIARDAASAAFESLREILNSSFEGQAIFAGTNTGGVALKQFKGGSAETAVNGAFASFFGFQPNDPAAANVIPSQLTGFVDNQLAQEFNDPAWGANWSDASGTDITVRLQNNVRVDISANANHGSIRDLVRSVVAVMQTSQGELAGGTFAALADKSVSLAAQSIYGIGGEQSRIGIAQEELKASTDRLSKKSDLLKAHVQKTEGVDAYEAAIRLNLLITQLETSYSITARISKLSLVNFV
jgi:flagellar hook-associated protein 3 FlgL